jgi:hypothetical protein
MAQWPYSTAQWAWLRRTKLQTNVLCEVCFKRGRLVVATTVDHIISIKNGGEPFPPLDQLMSMCATCHSAKTAARDRPNASGHRPALKGFDVNGLPIDPAHSFYDEAPRGIQKGTTFSKNGTDVPVVSPLSSKKETK